MGNLLKYGLIIGVIGFIYIGSQNSGSSYADNDIDLNKVLDITVDTLHASQEKLDLKKASSQSIPDDDQAFIDLADALGDNYNKAEPKLFDAQIAVSPQADASLLAYADTNLSTTLDEKEELLFKIEIDGENARIIASSRSGAINEHSFSGSGLLAGYLIGSMLSRQTRAGVNTSALANKKPITASAAARSRAGSGSHSKGK